MCKSNDLNFSVSMCVYSKDDPEHFKTAVESILNQSVKPSEVVLVVDGPVGKKLDSIIKSYEENDVFRIIRFKENKGHGNARRAGLQACENELVALMDADDISLPDRFEKQLGLFANDAELDIVGGNITEFIGEPEKVTGKRTVPQSDVEIKKYIKIRCPMNQMTVMFKKSSVEKAGGYIDWYCDEDYYLWLRMALAGMKFANSSDVLVNVRTSSDMYKRRGGWKYFKSEFKLQKFMLEKKITGINTFAVNVLKRFIVQVLLPNRIRAVVFQRFAREKYGAEEKI